LLMAQLAEQFHELLGTTTALITTVPAVTATSSALLVAALFASLYFMWNIRHPKTE